jgi:hypothetical protein
MTIRPRAPSRTGLLEAEPFGGRTAGGDEHGVPARRSRWGHHGRRPSTRRTSPPRDVGAKDQPYAAPLPENSAAASPARNSAYRRRLARQAYLRPADQRRRDAERGEHGGELDADRATDDDDFLGDPVKRVDLVGVWRAASGIVERDARVVRRAGPVASRIARAAGRCSSRRVRRVTRQYGPRRGGAVPGYATPRAASAVRRPPAGRHAPARPGRGGSATSPSAAARTPYTSSWR